MIHPNVALFFNQYKLQKMLRKLNKHTGKSPAITWIRMKMHRSPLIFAFWGWKTELQEEIAKSKIIVEHGVY